MWRNRFLAGSIAALQQDTRRSGRPPKVTAKVEGPIVATIFHQQPAERTYWSGRTLAAKAGLSATTVRRLWQRNRLTPHLQRTFKL